MLNESTYLPAISLGLRDFIGTGWYSSEYIVGTKSIGNVNLTAGLGFGRLSEDILFQIHSESYQPILKTDKV